MNSDGDYVYDVALVFSHQIYGPFFCANTSPGLFDDVTKEMFASRIVLTTGIGENLLANNKFHGPIETVELKDKGLNLFSLIFPYRILIEREEQSGIGTIHRILIFVLQFREEQKSVILENMSFLEQQLRKFMAKQDLSFLESDQPDCDKKGKEFLNLLKDRINHVISLRLRGKEMGGTLFHLGNLPNISEQHKPIVGVLIMNPNGIKYSDLINNLPNLTEKQLNEFLEELELMGFISVEQESDDRLIIPH